MKKNLELILKITVITLALVEVAFVLANLQAFRIGYKTFLTDFIISLSLILTVHGIFTLTWMLYAWENPENIERHKSPKDFSLPKLSFTALIPARHEENVIRETIKSVNNINYPDHLKEVLILCREDDTKTIAKVEEAIKEIGNSNIKLVVFNSFPISKPCSLNQGLSRAKNNIIAVFDAEDEIHKNIYSVVNTVLLSGNVDFVQSGVQLMNYRSRWYSALNVLEYFFWYKSALHFFSKVAQIAPLGGNTVFFKKVWLKGIGGWDEDCLTEDADIGVRLISAGAKLKVVYDEQHVTREETPPNLASFIRQRARWNQGFLQILFKGNWVKLPTFRQKLFTIYILLSAELQTILLLYSPFAIWIAFSQKLPVWVSLFSFIPLFLLLLQVAVQIVGLYEFAKAYGLKFPFWMPLKILVTFYPYQLILMLSSFRALYRVIFSLNGWEKTLHINAHREMTQTTLFTQDVK